MTEGTWRKHVIRQRERESTHRGNFLDPHGGGQESNEVLLPMTREII